jgi:hypothetical protein
MIPLGLMLQLRYIVPLFGTGWEGSVETLFCWFPTLGNTVPPQNAPPILPTEKIWQLNVPPPGAPLASGGEVERYGIIGV